MEYTSYKKNQMLHSKANTPYSQQQTIAGAREDKKALQRVLLKGQLHNEQGLSEKVYE
jgi:hypothetical protein